MQNDKRLSSQDRWEAAYLPVGQSPGLRARAKQSIRRLLGEKAVALFKAYDNWLLWEVLYQEHLPRGAGLQVLEIGSAPGTHLIELNRRFGYEPFGVEYTSSGAETNRALFSANGLKAENVFEADVFSDRFLKQFPESFDVVLSHGFIEHFKDLDAVVGTHLALLKPGGTLVIGVPNFRGIYYPWYLLFRRSVLSWHNFEAMRFRTFKRLFDPARLRTKYCGSYGTFSLNMFMLPRTRLGGLLATVRFAPQALLNFGLHTLFRRRGPELPLCSPHRLFIGVKEQR